MKKISLFIAMSLDGYIADSKGSVDWLAGQGNEDENVDAYSEFVKDIDTVIMGWNTYHQIVTELSPKEWVYNDLTTYVVTHSPKASSDKIHFTNEDPALTAQKAAGRRWKRYMDMWRGKPGSAAGQKRYDRSLLYYGYSDNSGIRHSAF